MLIERFKNLRGFMANPTRFLDHASSGEATVQIKQLGPKRFVLVFDPLIARDVLIRRSTIYVQNRSIFDRIKPLTGPRGLVQLNGPPSKAARGQVRPMLSRDSLAKFSRIIEDNSLAAFDTIDVRRDFAPGPFLMELVLQNALEMFLDVERKEDQTEIGEIFLELHALCGKRMLSPFVLPLILPSPQNKQIVRLARDLRARVKRHIDSKSSFAEGSIPALFRDDPNMIDHCLTFLFAGHETTAASICFTVLLLAQNQIYQDHLIEGIPEQVLSIYKEGLRLFPPAYMLVRQAERADTLGNESIRRGDQVVIGLKQILSDSRWFAKADSFFPERFLERSTPEMQAFFPFGLGPKSCIGEQVAYLEAEIILREFGRAFEIAPMLEAIRATPMVTLHPDMKQTIRLSRRKIC